MCRQYEGRERVAQFLERSTPSITVTVNLMRQPERHRRWAAAASKERPEDLLTQAERERLEDDRLALADADTKKL